MRYILIVLIITMTGCNDWSRASSDYKCTEEQHAKAIKEAKEYMSLGNVTQYASKIYADALIRNCEKVN